MASRRSRPAANLLFRARGSCRSPFSREANDARPMPELLEIGRHHEEHVTVTNIFLVGVPALSASGCTEVQGDAGATVVTPDEEDCVEQNVCPGSRSASTPNASPRST